MPRFLRLDQMPAEWWRADKEGPFRNAVNPSLGASGSTSLSRTILKGPSLSAHHRVVAPSRSAVFLEPRARMRLVVYLGQMLEVKVSIDLCGTDVGVPQEFLDTAQIMTGFE